MSSEEIRVLLIEHDRKESQAIRDMLAKAEDVVFNVEGTHQFSKGLERLAKDGIDVVLMDLSLPDGQNSDMVATLRDKAPSVPVVALTDRRDGVAGDKALAQGTQDYLVKSQITSAWLAHSLITAIERRKAEEESRQRAEFYKQLAEQNPDGLIVVDAQSQVIFQSPGTEDVSGFLSGELENTLTFDLIHPDDLPRAMQTFMDFLTKPGSPNRVECRYKHKDGTWRHAQAVGTNHLDNPAIKGIIITTRDITEHKMMEEDLKKSKEDLKRAMDKLRQLVDELSTPVIQLWSHVLALPLIGVMDDHRARQIMETLLKRIVETQSELVILDVTGVPSMDTMVINHLVRTIKSASLLGAQCMLVGMKPELAQSVIQLDLDVSGFVIKRDLEEGLKWAIKTMSDQARDGHTTQKGEAHTQPTPPNTAASHPPSTPLHARS